MVQSECILTKELKHCDEKYYYWTEQKQEETY